VDVPAATIVLATGPEDEVLVAVPGGPWQRTGLFGAVVTSQWNRPAAVVPVAPGEFERVVSIASDGTWTTIDRIRDGYAAISPDGRFVASYGSAHTLRIQPIGADNALEPIKGAADERFAASVPLWSPSGRALAAATCDQSSCSVALYQMSGDWVVGVQPFVPLAVGDRFVLGYPSVDEMVVKAYDFERLRPAPVASILDRAWHGTAVGPSAFVLVGKVADRDGESLVFIDLAHDVERDLGTLAPDRYLYTDIHVPGFAVIGPRDGLWASNGPGSAPRFDLVELASGRWWHDAFELEPVWLHK
jgi:hypothetical protein